MKTARLEREYEVLRCSKQTQVNQLIDHVKSLENMLSTQKKSIAGDLTIVDNSNNELKIQLMSKERVIDQLNEQVKTKEVLEQRIKLSHEEIFILKEKPEEVKRLISKKDSLIAKKDSEKELQRQKIQEQKECMENLNEVRLKISRK